MEIWIGTEKISQSTLGQRIAKIREKLTEEGSSEGKVVASRSKSQLGYIIHYLACMETGAIPLFLAPDYPVENSYFVEACSLKYIMEADGQGETEVIRLENPGKGPELGLEPGAIIQMTSATTGRPKLVLRTKENLEAEVQAYLERLQYKEGSTFLSMAPFYHSYSFCCVLLPCMKLGGKLVLPDMMIPRRVIQLCEQHSVNYLYGIPWFFSKMTEVKNFNSLGDGIERVMSTAQVVTEELARKFEEKFGIPVSTQYGSTETGCMAVGRVLEDEGYQYPLSVITPHSETDEAGRKHLHIECPDVLGWYIDEQGKRRISENWYDTRDIAEINEKGGVRILGRSDDVLIRTGEKIDAKRVALLLEELPEIRKAKLVLDGKSNLLTCLYAGDENLDEKKAKDHLRQYLPEYQVPQRFEWDREMNERKASWKERK